LFSGGGEGSDALTFANKVFGVCWVGLFVRLRREVKANKTSIGPDDSSENVRLLKKAAKGK
jgi:hypothetical protein